MKHHNIFLLAATSALLTNLSFPPPAWGEITPVPQKGESPAVLPGNVIKASDLIGKSVIRGAKDKVAKVEDVVVGLKSGRIVAVIVSLNENSTLRAVPPRVLHYDLLQQVLHLKANSAKVEDSAELLRPSWKEALEASKLAALYKYYDEEPFFALTDKDGPDPVGPMEMATRLDGAPVINAKQEKIGTVNNSMVDLSTGHIPFVIVSTGAYTGVEGALTPVPAGAMTYDSKRESLVFDTTKEALGKLPHFKAGEWADLDQGTYADSVYAAYGIKRDEVAKPAAETAANEQVPAEKPKELTPLDQGNSKEDVETTTTIRKEIMARKDISFHGKNVKIITNEGKVRLQGEVKSDEEKRVINEIAVQCTDRDRVENLLVVK